MTKKGVTPIFFEVQELNDIGRFSCVFERVPRATFLFKKGEKYYLAAELGIFYERESFLYTKISKPGSYLAYRTFKGKEESIITDVPTELSFIYSPIIKLKKMRAPLSIRAGQEKLNINLIEVDDLDSLSMVSLHSWLQEEALLPVFYFRTGGRWYLANIVPMGESWGRPSLFYLRTKGLDPTERFIEYDDYRIPHSRFCAEPERASALYIKIIRLKRVPFEISPRPVT